MIQFAMYIFMVITISMICRKTGHPMWLGIICFVPIVGQFFFIGLLYFLALSKWPRWEEAGLDTMPNEEDKLDQIFE